MAYRPFPISGFNGLRLDLAPDAAGPTQAIDGLNFELDRKGAVRSRDGYAKLTVASGATRYDRVAPVAAGLNRLQAGPNNAGTGADDSSVGAVAWTNPGNITAEDGSVASVSNLVTQSSHYLKATNFGFAIPGTATITGILAEVKRKDGNGPTYCVDSAVRLVKGGVIQAPDKADGSTPWPGVSLTFKAYGGATDLWSGTWTPADVNAATFGMVISCRNTNALIPSNPQIDVIRVTVYYTTLSTGLVLASATAGRIDAINPAGAVFATVVTATDEAASYANVGSPSGSSTYIAVGSGSVLRKFSGGAFSTVAAAPKCKYLALQSPDNRLVCANVSTLPSGSGAASASTSLVVFSDEGSPEVFSPNSFVYLTPGDGENIQGVASWSNQTYVFKSTRCFVFFGNSEDSAGNPIFNYRPFWGLGLASPQGLAPSPHGVFVLDLRGIYLFTGGSTERISSPLDPLFLGGASEYFTATAANAAAISRIAMCWFNDRLYVGYPSGSSAVNDKTLVYDYNAKDWLLWDVPIGSVCSVGTQPSTLVFAYGTGTNDLGQYRPNTYTTDAGTPIQAFYRSGFYTAGNAPSQEVTIRETILHGSGSPSFALSRDFDVALPTTGGGAQQTVTLGTSPHIAQGRHRVAQRGREFSYQISGTAPWEVTGLTHHIKGVQEPGLEGD